MLYLSPKELLLESLNMAIYTSEVKTQLYPKFGYCFEVRITSMEVALIFVFPSVKGITVLLSDSKTKSFIQVDPNSHQGEV